MAAPVPTLVTHTSFRRTAALFPCAFSIPRARAALHQASATTVAAANQLSDVKLEREPLRRMDGREAGGGEGSGDGEQAWTRRGLVGAAAALAMAASSVNLSCEPAQAFEFSLGICKVGFRSFFLWSCSCLASDSCGGIQL